MKSKTHSDIHRHLNSKVSSVSCLVSHLSPSFSNHYGKGMATIFCCCAVLQQGTKSNGLMVLYWWWTNTEYSIHIKLYEILTLPNGTVHFTQCPKKKYCMLEKGILGSFMCIYYMWLSKTSDHRLQQPLQWQTLRRVLNMQIFLSFPYFIYCFWDGFAPLKLTSVLWPFEG